VLFCCLYIKSTVYKLANNIELVTYNNSENEDQYSVLVKRKRVKEFVINEMIYNFLKLFHDYKSFNDVIDFYVAKTGAKKNERPALESQLKTFINQLTTKKWLVQEDSDHPEKSYELLLEEGSQFHNYSILKVLANNRLTDVYLAKDSEHKEVVIKLLNKEKFRDLDRYGRYEIYFKNEYDFLKKFNSPHINKAYNFYKKKDELFFTIKYIKGQSVFRYLSNTTITAKQKKEVVLKILKGFSLIHNQNMYHGDIHSGNVMLTSKLAVKIIDFGHSNYIDAPSRLKGDLKIRNGGAHNFIPPERAMRSIESKFNAVEKFQSEVYQIGLLIYFIYVRSIPFNAKTWKTLVDEKRTFNCSTYEPFLNRRMPKRVRLFIIKALKRDPNLRFNDASDMLMNWKLQING